MFSLIDCCFDKGFPNLETYKSILDISIKALESLNGIEEMNAFRKEKKKDKNGPIVLAKWGADALIGYSYIYDLARDLEQYHTLGIDTYKQLLEHHWNHHILPQLADIVFSNQISRGDKNDDKNDLKRLLKKAETEQPIQIDEVEYTLTLNIKDTTLGSENMMDRPRLEVSLDKKTLSKEDSEEEAESSTYEE